MEKGITWNFKITDILNVYENKDSKYCYEVFYVRSGCYFVMYDKNRFNMFYFTLINFTTKCSAMFCTLRYLFCGMI